MLLETIITIVIAIAFYMLIYFILTVLYDGDLPLWAIFLVLPINVVFFIILFPWIVKDKKEFDKAYDESIKVLKNKRD